jgi:hypothetical protein
MDALLAKEFGVIDKVSANLHRLKSLFHFLMKINFIYKKKIKFENLPGKLLQHTILKYCS